MLTVRLLRSGEGGGGSEGGTCPGWAHLGNMKAFASGGSGGSVVAGDYLGAVGFGAGALPAAGYYDHSRDCLCS
ncbi:hypothetical protein BO221_24995 [Archangium sp. Cb G35]|nr:hypothetical protein BO221_24995 [Archangium sp. Cb G35]